MDNPEALFIGLGIGGMFIAIAVIQIIKRKSSKTWDGEVVDKKTEKKKRKRYTNRYTDGDGNQHEDYYWEDYILTAWVGNLQNWIWCFMSWIISRQK